MFFFMVSLYSHLVASIPGVSIPAMASGRSERLAYSRQRAISGYQAVRRSSWALLGVSLILSMVIVVAFLRLSFLTLKVAIC
ncbi:hypothetical protein H696_01729 [Fonticula alba]|uniref:Uncharacterized protein n=1 Tax=Fonticula alba TaxID=691883 RepID=A0A058ZD50_FONAL|nr:hypothetical protein H696_01729 [Fonticula alba]KCV72335.1 hypothetical protein H696_01729 [Fonticula alba]|eukprot:XP_009493913.1 hypothetical protein H696_01729 [Fonticula alba]